MLDKLKQIGQLKNLQDELKNTRYEAELNGLKIVINGSFNVEEVMIPDGLTTEDIQEAVKEALNQAIYKAQRDMAGKFQSMGMGM